MRAKGLDALEMYAFAETRDRAVICFAQIINSMGQIEGDFEKGEAKGANAALTLIAAIAEALR